MLNWKTTAARAVCVLIIAFAFSAPLLTACAEGLPLLTWGDKTVAVFLATDDQSIADMRVQSGGRMVMTILIGVDFVMTEEYADAIKSEIRLGGAEGEYNADSVFLAEADEGNNPDLEVYFAVPDESISALYLTFDEDKPSVALKDVPQTFNESLGALIETFSPSDFTLKSLDEDESFSISIGAADDRDKEAQASEKAEAKPLTDVLKSEHKEAYAEAYDFLKGGGVFKDSVKNKAAKGLQRLLCELGCEVKIDGKIGPMTLDAAFSATRGYWGAPDETGVSEINQDAFETMLLALLISEDEAAARAYLTEEYGEEAADEALRYYAAADAFRDGRYYTAFQGYSDLSQYRLSEEYAAACAQPWPENGEIERNKAFASKKCSLTVEATLEEGMASCVRIRSADGQDVSALFINTSGAITVKLPEGDYTVTVGTGDTWFGEREAFGGGQGAYYATIYNDGDEEVFSLKSDFSYTLTLKSAAEEGDLDSSDLDYGAFIGE